MKQIIIYGIGEVFHRNQDRIDWNEVVSVADKNEAKIGCINGRQVITPDKIQEYQYDHVVIFTNKYFKNIRKELQQEYGIPDSTILHWSDYMRQKDAERAYEIISVLKHFCSYGFIESILDTNSLFFQKYCITSISDAIDEDVFIEYLGELKNDSWEVLYDRCLETLQEADDYYDLITFLESDEKKPEKEKLLRIFHDTFDKSRFFLFNHPYKNHESITYEIEKKYNCEIETICLNTTMLLVVDKRKPFKTDKIGVYVVTHKDYPVKCRGMYRPICVGNRYRKEGFPWEGDGENITHLNDKINECTAMYWMWKNTDHAYIGLNHYRRYFGKHGYAETGYVLGEERALKILDSYDMIISKAVVFTEETVIEQLEKTIDGDAFSTGYSLIKELLGKRQPDYLDAFDTVMNGHHMFPCNLFITRKEIFDAYCEWLFSFLIEAAENIDISEYDSYSKRVMGFFAERMLTVWLMNQNLKVKELPYIVLEENV